MPTPWSSPSYIEITGAEAVAIRASLRRQAFDARECFGCLAPLRDRTSTFCSAACRDEMQDPGDVDLPAGIALLIRLPLLVRAMDRHESHRHAAA